MTQQDVAFRDDHQDHHDLDVDCSHPQHWLPQDTRRAAQIGADGMTSLADADCIHPPCGFLPFFVQLCPAVPYHAVSRTSNSAQTVHSLTEALYHNATRL